MKKLNESSDIPSLAFIFYVVAGIILVILTNRFDMPWTDWIATTKLSKYFALFAILVMCTSLILSSIKIKISLLLRSIFFTIAVAIAIFWDAVYIHSPSFALVSVLISVGIVLLINNDNWFRSKN